MKLLIKLLIRKKIKISVAESCTGGLLSSSITSVAGASKIFKGGIVAYSDEIKQNLLSVPKSFLDTHGAVSEEVAIHFSARCNDTVVRVSWLLNFQSYIQSANSRTFHII